MLKLLIVDGNKAEARAQTKASGRQTQSELYEKTLLFLAPDANCTIIYPADQEKNLPNGEELEQYDGIVWTGSSLNIYDDDPAITRQIDFMKKCFERRTKIFGSCWGLQVAVVAAGGKVTKNSKGREIGVARHIQMTDEGRSHPLYKDKNDNFDAVAIHLDHVLRLPAGATVLSSNEMSTVQALEFERGPSVFWGVQYHPEFDLEYIASLMQKYKKMLVEEKICADEAAVDKLSADYRALGKDHSREDIKSHYKMDADVLDPCCRLQEISNWLDFIR